MHQGHIMKSLVANHVLGKPWSFPGCCCDARYPPTVGGSAAWRGLAPVHKVTVKKRARSFGE